MGLRLLSQSRSPRPWVSRCCIVESHIQNWAFCRRHGAISDRIAEAHLCLDTIRATALGGPGMVPHAELQGVWSNGRARKLIKAQPPVTFYLRSMTRPPTDSFKKKAPTCGAQGPPYLPAPDRGKPVLSYYMAILPRHKKGPPLNSKGARGQGVRSKRASTRWECWNKTRT